MRPLKPLAAAALTLSLAVAAFIPAVSATAPMSELLRYSVIIEGSASGNCSARLGVESAANFTVVIREDGEEVAVPRASVNSTYSGTGACGSSDCLGRVDAMEVALRVSEEFVVSDPVLGVLRPYFDLYLSQVPLFLSEAACCGIAGNVTGREVSATAVLTTYEGRRAVEYRINYSATYSSGRVDNVYTVAFVDLATLEPLALNSTTVTHGPGCGMTIRMKALLKNVDELPAGWVSEVRAATSAGDALVVVGGADLVRGPEQVGEGRISLGIRGAGRTLVVVAYPPSLGDVEVLANRSGSPAVIYRSGESGVYAIKTINAGGGARVEVVFGNASVAVPATTLPPPESMEGPQPATAQPNPLPYVIGAFIAAIAGLAVLVIIRRQ